MLLGSLLLGLASLPALTWSSENPIALGNFHRDLWTTREGLPHNSINALAQTREGYLWLATWEGPVRFNGREFTLFDRAERIGLPDIGVHSLLAEPDGGLLIGGIRGGLTHGTDDSWSGLEPTAGMVIALYRDRRGRLWVGGDDLVRIDADGHRHTFSEADGFPGGFPWTFCEDQHGQLWIGGSFGLLQLQGDTVISVGKALGLPAVGVTQLALDGSGRLLAGTERGLFVLAEPDRFEPLTRELAEVSVSRVLAEDDGTLWIGTRNAGLFRLGAVGLERYGVEQGLPDSRVRSILRDREGSLWIGTNAGLVRLRKAPMVALTRERGLAGDFVRAVLPRRAGGVWVGSSEGLSLVDDHGIHRAGQAGELEHESILSLAETADGDLWIGTFTHGALRWNGERVVQRLSREHGLPSAEVRSVLPARDGSLWLGTLLGLAQWHNGSMRVLTEDDGLPSNVVYGLMQDRDGGIWIATMSGVAVYRDGRMNRVPIEQVGSTGAAFAFWQDPQSANIWIASDHGLVRWRAQDAMLALVGRDAGLPFGKVFTVVADRLGNFWLSGNRGVLRLARAEAEAVADGRASRLLADRYAEADGMASSQANGSSTPAATLAADGSVWFATSRGVAIVQPERLAGFAERPPPIVIEAINVDGVDLPLRDGLRLSAGVGRIRIEFAGLGFVMPQRIRYRYLLEGFDQQWVERGARADAELTNLPPGDYRFRVAAAYLDGEWSAEEASWSFSVAPFWWQRGDLRLLAALAGTALLVLLLRIRTRQLRLASLRLQALVEQRTADLQRQTERLLAMDAERGALLERLRQQSEAFERQAREDALTGLPNRRAFEEALTESLQGTRSQGRALSLILIDVDRFKQINDRYSHAVGDATLRVVAEALRKAVRPGAGLSRWGGEEFAVLLPDCDIEAALHDAEHLRVAIAAIDGESLAPGLQLTASLGVAQDHGNDDRDRLLARADAALYEAKQSGRNRVCRARV